MATWKITILKGGLQTNKDKLTLKEYCWDSAKHHILQKTKPLWNFFFFQPPSFVSGGGEEKPDFDLSFYSRFRWQWTDIKNLYHRYHRELSSFKHFSGLNAYRDLRFLELSWGCLQKKCRPRSDKISSHNRIPTTATRRSGDVWVCKGNWKQFANVNSAATSIECADTSLLGLHKWFPMF